MPPHSSYADEKSPVDKWDYEGLQLDTRARENLDKHLDDSKPQGFLDDDFDQSSNYLNEKQSHSIFMRETGPTSPTSPDSTVGTDFGYATPVVPPKTDLPKDIDDSTDSPPPVPPERRTWGLRRRHFWELFGLLLSLILAAAIIGGVVGGLQARNGSSHSSSSLAPNAASNDSIKNTTTATFAPLLPENVMVGSPLAMVSYDEGPGQPLADRQAFRMCFQTANGNIKEAVSYHLDPWISAVPILTDAINNTGLATVTYLNQTSQQGSIFYVGANGLLQEKRKIYNNTDYWLPGTLNNLNIPAIGNISLPEMTDDPKNDWDSYRMAAVYSVNFKEGPGIRLFYHSVQLNGTTYVQEMIWNQKNDIWSQGAQLTKPYPNSHLAATVDENSGILRVFFSSGNKTLSEAWLDISNPQAGYSSGLDFEGVLYDNAADIAAIALFGTTYVYHYSAIDEKTAAGIHELSIAGIPKSTNNQETYNVSSPLVAAPMLSVNDKTSLYQPLAVSYTAVAGMPQQVYVFWADMVTGDPTTSASGFEKLSLLSKPLANSTWPLSGQQPISLGSQNAQPT